MERVIVIRNEESPLLLIAPHAQDDFTGQITEKLTENLDCSCVINQGWNTILIKVNQDHAPWLAKTQGDGNFWVKFGTVASGCGAIVYLPGLPTVEKAATASGNTIVELRLDAPIGKLIGRVPVGQTTCPVEKIAGVHSLFLVFPNDMMKMVDWFRFE